MAAQADRQVAGEQRRQRQFLRQPGVMDPRRQTEQRRHAGEHEQHRRRSQPMPRRTARSLFAPNAFCSRPGDVMNAGTSSTRNETRRRAVPERRRSPRPARTCSTAESPPACESADRQRDGEPAQQHGQLHEVHPRRSEQAAGGEVRRHQPAADQAPGPLRQAGDDVQDPGDADQLAGQDREGREPQHRRDEAAHRAAEVMLEQIARREEAVRRTPGARRAGRSRTPAAATRCAADPFHHHALSPSRYPRPVAPTVEPGADVRGEHRGEDEDRAQLPVRDEETRRALHAAADGQAQRSRPAE